MHADSTDKMEKSAYTFVRQRAQCLQVSAKHMQCSAPVCVPKCLNKNAIVYFEQRLLSTQSDRHTESACFAVLGAMRKPLGRVRGGADG